MCLRSPLTPKSVVEEAGNFLVDRAVEVVSPNTTGSLFTSCAHGGS